MRKTSGAARALTLARFVRGAILVACLAVALGAWLADTPVLLGLALVVAAEELWETTVVIRVLRAQPRCPRSPLAAHAPGR